MKQFTRKELVQMNKVYEDEYRRQITKGESIVFAHLMAATQQTKEKNKILSEKKIIEEIKNGI